MNARESFPRLLLSEWTKLRSVSRWVITFLAAMALTIGLSALLASANRSDANVHRNFVVGPHNDPVSDMFYFVHQSVTGDTTMTVRVASLAPTRQPDERRVDGEPTTLLDDPSPYAAPAAGIMIKDGTRSGSSYASVLLTKDRGVRVQSDFTQDHEGSASSGTRWLRLVRAGSTITGYESADGATWTPVGSVTPRNLPATAEIGFYVSSAPAVYVSRGGASSSVGERPTSTDATFDNVTLTGSGQWRGTQVVDANADGRMGKGGVAGGRFAATGAGSGAGFTVTGTGKVGPQAPDDDIVEGALIGVIAGLMALVAVGALFATSEYRRGMIRTTFAATPRRGRVLAAKAVVLGATAYAVSLVGVVTALALALPTMKQHGFAPPAFPTPSFSDGPVLRALLLSAAFMTLVALFAMAVGMLVRRSAAAITTTIVLVLLPLIVGMVLPGTSPRWLMYTTLAGGMATQRAKPPTVTLAEPWAMIGPWAGIGIVAAYTCAALGLAWWRLRRTDA
ncbi:ABC transporter permease subunit [Asanoa sp. WMMD1127]|uniref:ABC transporter permease subunit n=1 Tax=Asanoa sp. WMMD1127 TaxID=3016107 RepID=UPI0024170ED0|nr:ABC transporter permease subunit [Asanoa sp. WMMD1127]MDG4824734.1 ABC transporter permease subunit [Asanoa sp. WMMD1127]